MSNSNQAFKDHIKNIIFKTLFNQFLRVMSSKIKIENAMIKMYQPINKC